MFEWRVGDKGKTKDGRDYEIKRVEGYAVTFAFDGNAWMTVNCPEDYLQFPDNAVMRHPLWMGAFNIGELHRLTWKDKDLIEQFGDKWSRVADEPTYTIGAVDPNTRVCRLTLTMREEGGYIVKINEREAFFDHADLLHHIFAASV